MEVVDGAILAASPDGPYKFELEPLAPVEVPPRLTMLPNFSEAIEKTEVNAPNAIEVYV